MAKTAFVLKPKRRFDNTSAQRSVAGDIMVLSCSSVRASFRNIDNTIYSRVFDTLSPTYINGALWDRDERITVWSQKVKVTVE